MSTKLAFFKESILSIKTTGTVMPSSRFLISRMLNNIDFEKANVIVEFGPGNGIITNQILNKMNDNAILICFEINNEFIKQLRAINDKRLIIINQSAETLGAVLVKHQINKVDYIVSSIPLSILPFELSSKILQVSKQFIQKKGLFLQYQYSLGFRKHFNAIFGKKNVFLSFELMNFPPAFIYKCKL